MASQQLTLKQALDLAVQRHGDGDLSEAEELYGKILQADPNHAVALHLLGVIAHQVGENEHTLGGVLGNDRIAEHPDTGRAIAGIQIPSWRTILDLTARCYEMTGLGYLMFASRVTLCLLFSLVIDRFSSFWFLMYIKFIFESSKSFNLSPFLGTMIFKDLSG